MCIKDLNAEIDLNFYVARIAKITITLEWYTYDHGAHYCRSKRLFSYKVLEILIFSTVLYLNLPLK